MRFAPATFRHAIVNRPMGPPPYTATVSSGWIAANFMECSATASGSTSVPSSIETCGGMAKRFSTGRLTNWRKNPGYPGFFRQFVNLPVENLFAMPPHVSMELGTLVEPLAVALHSMKFAAIQPDDTVAVYGGGPIGLLTIACLKVAGAKRILAVEPLAHRRELAKHMGADEAIDPSAQESIRGVHCAIDCAAKEDTTNAAIRAVRNGGRVLLTGIHTGALVPFEVSPMRRKELAILMVRRSNDELPAALSLIAER